MSPSQVLVQNIEEIRSKLQQQESLIRSLDPNERRQLQECCLMHCPHKQRLSQVLLETIEVLDATKKSFKSKQLENLRKRLTQELANNQ